MENFSAARGAQAPSAAKPLQGYHLHAHGWAMVLAEGHNPLGQPPQGAVNGIYCFNSVEDPQASSEMLLDLPRCALAPDGVTITQLAYKPDVAALTQSVRAQRDALLAQDDWRLLRELDTGDPAPAWLRPYRQALRDITKQEGFPLAVVWPLRGAAQAAEQQPAVTQA